MDRRPPKTCGFFLLATILAAVAASGAETTGQAVAIPIDDPLTIAKCGGCHARDSAGIMRRLSFIRTTPEVWEQAIKRMVRLHGFNGTPEETGKILRYLSKNNGLAPEEAKPVFWEAEHRRFRDQDDGTITPAPLQTTCNTCHTVGRVLGQRRTREDYLKLANMHMALFPYTEISIFRPYVRRGTALAAVTTTTGMYSTDVSYPEPPKKPAKSPLDAALDYLAENQPLITPEWTAWKSIMHTPDLSGTWLVNGFQKGKGRVYGQLTIEPAPIADEFLTKIELHYANTGRVVKRTGKGIVYTGYSWRGRSKLGDPDSTTKDPNYAPPENKEAMMISRDGASMEGRWFWGGYDEFGIDVQLSRLGKETVVFGTDTYSLRSPSTNEVTVYGGGFAASLAPRDVDFGPGVKVLKVLQVTPTSAKLQVAVSEGLPDSIHDISIHGVSAVKAFAVYREVAYIKVMPDASFARLGGTIAAKQYAQFEAVAFAAGPDGAPGTADDVVLGPVTANWTLEEFYSTPDDDDVNYVGEINDAGLFTPSLEGPNPKRKKQANNLPTDNYGDVWVDASFKAPDGKLLKAKSYLVVGVPLYVHYDQPEVSQ
jgi:quinohemoprotein amine dehydrogenase